MFSGTSMETGIFGRIGDRQGSHCCVAVCPPFEKPQKVGRPLGGAKEGPARILVTVEMSVVVRTDEHEAAIQSLFHGFCSLGAAE